jgi:exosome complex component RRP45
MKSQEPSTVEREFILKALKEGRRVDGRGLLDYRNVSFSFGVDLGTLEVRIGKTWQVLSWTRASELFK